MKVKFLILLIGCFAFLSCSESKDDFPDELPAITEKGKNTAGCIVDGELFVLSGDIGIQKSNPNVSFTNYFLNGYKTISISISDFNKLDKSIVINLSFKGDLKLNQKIPVIYNLKEAVEKVDENMDEIITNASFFGKNNRYETFNISENYIKFSKIDIENRIISGVFNFDLKNLNTEKIVKLTKGRFDLKINDYTE